MIASVVANEFVGHRAKKTPKRRPFKPERVGHPEKLRQLHGVGVLEWYHPIVSYRQQEKTGKGLPPASLWDVHQFSFQGIHVHGVEFLDELRLTPDVFLAGSK